MVHYLFMAPKQTDPQFKLRLTAELRDDIANAASTNSRSMNAEIVSRLEASFANPRSTSTLDQIATGVMQKIVEMPVVTDSGDMDRLFRMFDDLKKAEAKGVMQFMEFTNEVIQKMQRREDDRLNATHNLSRDKDGLSTKD